MKNHGKPLILVGTLLFGLAACEDAPSTSTEATSPARSAAGALQGKKVPRPQPCSKVTESTCPDPDCQRYTVCREFNQQRSYPNGCRSGCGSSPSDPGQVEPVEG